MAACGNFNYEPQGEQYAPQEPQGQTYGGLVNNPAPQMPGGEDCEDCGQLVQTTRKIQVPCTKNEYRSYEVKVPRQVVEKVARTVQYTDYEDRQKTVNYTVNTCQTRYREEEQEYQVPVEKKMTRMVNVTKKVPKTIYVDVVTQEPQEYTTTVQETRKRTVKIPYTVNVPETKSKVVNERVPVQKSKIVYDDVTKTVMDTQMKTECRPVTKMITKEIPVFHWNPKTPAPCNEGDCKPVQPPVVEKQQVAVTYEAPAQFDADGNGMLDAEERAAAARAGQLKVVPAAAPQAQAQEQNVVERAGGAVGGAVGAVGRGVGGVASGVGRGVSGVVGGVTGAAAGAVGAVTGSKRSRSRSSGRKRSSSRGRKRSSSRGRKSSSRRKSGRSSRRRSPGRY